MHEAGRCAPDRHEDLVQELLQRADQLVEVHAERHGGLVEAGDGGNLTAVEGRGDDGGPSDRHRCSSLGSVLNQPFVGSRYLTHRPSPGDLMPLIVALLAAVALVPPPLPQGPDARPAAVRPPPPRAAARVTAARAVPPPVIDGKDDDAVWATAQAG